MNILGGETGDAGRKARQFANSRGITVRCDTHQSTGPGRGPTRAPLSACGAPVGPKPGIRGVTLPGRGETVLGTAALKVTRRRGGGDRRQDGLWRGRGGWEKPKNCGCRREVPPPSPVPRALGGDYWPDPALGRTHKNPLTFTVSRGRHGGRPPARGPPNAPANFSGIRAVRGAPSCQDPRRAAPTSAFRPASPAGDLPRRPRRGRAAAATHLARQQEPFSEEEKKGRLQEGRERGR